MSGLDKIIADIGESAHNQYNDIIAAAEKEADALLKSEKTAADSDAESYVNRAKERIKTAENAEEAQAQAASLVEDADYTMVQGVASAIGSRPRTTYNPHSITFYFQSNDTKTT